MGMKHFSKVNWDALHTLNLCRFIIIAANNQIGGKGAKYLSKVWLKNIKDICLGTR
jgi:hypothetical protein